MGVDQSTRLRVLVEIAEERTADPRSFARVKAAALADARWFAQTAQATCGHLSGGATLEADIEQAAMGHVEARMAALRAEGCAEHDVTVYPAFFALGIGEYQSEIRTGLKQIEAGAAIN